MQKYSTRIRSLLMNAAYARKFAFFAFVVFAGYLSWVGIEGQVRSGELVTVADAQQTPSCGAHLNGELYGPTADFVYVGDDHGATPSREEVSIDANGVITGRGNDGPVLGNLTFTHNDPGHDNLTYDRYTGQFSGWALADTGDWFEAQSLVFNRDEGRIEGQLVSSTNGTLYSYDTYPLIFVEMDVSDHDDVNPASGVVYRESTDGWWDSSNPFTVTFTGSDNCGGFRNAFVQVFVNDGLFAEGNPGLASGSLNSSSFSEDITLTTLLDNLASDGGYTATYPPDGAKIEISFRLEDLAGNVSTYASGPSGEDDDLTGDPDSRGEANEDTEVLFSRLSSEYSNPIANKTYLNWDGFEPTGLPRAGFFSRDSFLARDSGPSGVDLGITVNDNEPETVPVDDDVYRGGMAGVFDGNKDWLQSKDDAADLLILGDITLSAWVKIRSDNDGTINHIVNRMAAGEGAADNYQYSLVVNDTTAGTSGRLEMFWESGNGANRNCASPDDIVPYDNDWHHVVTTRDTDVSSDVLFYVDGVQYSGCTGMVNATGGNDSVNQRVRIGKNGSNANYFEGQIDEVAIYDAVLDATQVSALYNDGLGYFHTGSEANLKSVWHMEEESWRVGRSYSVPDIAPTNPRPLIPVDKPEYVANGKLGGAAYFPEYSSHFYAKRYDHDFPQDAVTVQFWIKSGIDFPVSNPTPFSYGTEEGADYNEFLIRSEYDIYVNEGTPADFGGTLADGDWHHFVATWRSSDGETTIYKDGVQVQQVILQAGALLTPDGILVVGNDQDSEYGSFDDSQSLGDWYLDEMALYGRYFDQSDVDFWYNNGDGRAHDGTETGLVSAWQFDNDFTAQATVRDESLSADDHGTIVADVDSQVAGKIGRGISFYGDSGFLEIPDTPNVDLPGEMTNAFWMKRDTDASTAVQEVLIRGYSTEAESGNLQYFVQLLNGAAGTMRFGWERGAGADVICSGPSTPTDGQWHHYALVRSAGAGSTLDVQIYVDGALSASCTGLNPPTGTTASVIRTVVGNHPQYYGQTLDADLDDFGIWSRALSSGEVSALYNSGTGQAIDFEDTGLAVYYSFDNDVTPNPKSGIASYRLQIDDDIAFGSPEYDNTFAATTKQYRPKESDGLVSGNSYYARIITIDSAGNSRTPTSLNDPDFIQFTLIDETQGPTASIFYAEPTRGWWDDQANMTVTFTASDDGTGFQDPSVDLYVDDELVVEKKLTELAGVLGGSSFSETFSFDTLFPSVTLQTGQKVEMKFHIFDSIGNYAGLVTESSAWDNFVGGDADTYGETAVDPSIRPGKLAFEEVPSICGGTAQEFSWTNIEPSGFPGITEPTGAQEQGPVATVGPEATNTTQSTNNNQPRADTKQYTDAAVNIHNAAVFDGRDDFLGSDANTNHAVIGDLTLSAWVKLEPGTTGVQGIIGRRGDTQSSFANAPYVWDIRPNTGGTSGTMTLTWERGNRADYWCESNSEIVPLDGSWHHIAAVRETAGSAQSVWFFVDGEKFDDGCSEPAANGATESDVKTIIGRGRPTGHSSSGDDFKGAMSEIAVYSDNLSDADVRALWDGGAGYTHTGSETNLVIAYPLNEKTLFQDNSWDAVADGGSGLNPLDAFNGAYPVPGKLGSAAYFESDDDNFKSKRVENFDADARSVSLWVKTNQPSFNPFYNHASEAGAPNPDYFDFRIHESGNDPIVYQDSSPGASGQTFDDGAWHHVVLTWENTTGQVEYWLDNAIAASFTNHQVGQQLADNPLMILGRAEQCEQMFGPNGTNCPWLGGDPSGSSLDEVAVYDHALNSVEVSTLYNGGTGYAHTGSESGLISVWSFDDVSWDLQNIHDSALRNNNHGYPRNDIESGAVGQIGQAFELKAGASNHYLSVEPDESLRLQSDLTITAWVNIDAPDGVTDPIIGFGGDNPSSAPDNYSYLAQVNDDGSIQFFWERGGTVTNNQNCQTLAGVYPFDDQWHFLAFVRDDTDGTNADVDIYMDDTLYTSCTLQLPNNGDSTDQRLWIGRDRRNGFYYNGTLDELAVYDQALDTGTLSFNYAQGGSGTEVSARADNLVSLWRFDENLVPRGESQMYSMQFQVTSTLDGFGDPDFNASFIDETYLASSGTTSYTPLGLSAGTTYYARVVSTDRAGNVHSTNLLGDSSVVEFVATDDNCGSLQFNTFTHTRTDTEADDWLDVGEDVDVTFEVSPGLNTNFTDVEIQLYVYDEIGDGPEFLDSIQDVVYDTDDPALTNGVDCTALPQNTNCSGTVTIPGGLLQDEVKYQIRMRATNDLGQEVFAYYEDGGVSSTDNTRGNEQAGDTAYDGIYRDNDGSEEIWVDRGVDAAVMSGPVICTVEPVLVWDPAIEGDTASGVAQQELEIWDGAVGGNLFGGSKIYNQVFADGDTNFFEVPAGLLSDGQTYSARVITTDNAGHVSTPTDVPEAVIWTIQDGTCAGIQTLQGDVYANADVIGEGSTTFPFPQATYRVSSGGVITDFDSEGADAGVPFGDLAEGPAEYEEIAYDILGFPQDFSSPLSRPLIDALIPHARVIDTFTGLNKIGGVFELRQQDGAAHRRIHYHEGDLRIDETGLELRGGAGTIIIDGDLTIAGDVIYDGDTLVSATSQAYDTYRAVTSAGFIVRGDVMIEPQVTQVMGAFYVPGNDTGAHGPGLFTTEPGINRFALGGLVVARDFDLNRTYNGDPGVDEIYQSGEIRPAEVFLFDGRVVLNTPPGFSNLMNALSYDWKDIRFE